MKEKGDTSKSEKFKRITEGIVFRQWLANHMIPYTIKKVEELVEQGHKVVVFTSFDNFSIRTCEAIFCRSGCNSLFDIYCKWQRLNTVDTQTLRVRQKADADAKVIELVPEGEELTVVSEAKKDKGWVKVVMAEKDLSNIWLSEKLGVSQATVSKWMTNFSQPNLETLIKISKVLNVEVAELIRTDEV